jgi:hypothetical protein
MKIAILFGNDNIKGKINIVNGTLKKLSASCGIIKDENGFELSNGGRLEVNIDNFTLKTGAHPTIINVFTEKNPFSFNLRDVNSNTPIYVPEFITAVIPAEDLRDYQQISKDISSKMLISDFARFGNEPEESYENACSHNRDQYCPIWLGIARDMRMFRVGYQQENYKYNFWGNIRPCYHSIFQKQPIDKETPYEINFVIGPGAHCRPRNIRQLECGTLPILRAIQDEGEMQYHLTSFATLEKEVLTEKSVRGSDWLASYANTNFNMLSDGQKEEIKDLLDKEMHNREQEVICVMHIEAVNRGKTPNYAFFKTPYFLYLEPPKENDKTEFKNGMSFFQKAEKAYGITMLDGQPIPDEEMSILVQPGEKVTFDILLPHSPVNQKRAEKLFEFDYEAHLNACRDFWSKKLDSSAQIAVPEKAVDERIKAGLLHCDLVTLGLEPDGPALATIGWYGPIGTESAPIIQYYDSIGWHKLAERSIQFFLERQLESGFIQNYNNYQSETGPLLWTAGEHFRYTRDMEWLKKVMPKLMKAADYLLEWRERNKLPELRETGAYGLVDGKVADPDDFYHSYFLNAGSYIGLARMVEMAAEIDPGYSEKLKNEIKDYKQDIIDSVYYAQAKAPLMPVADGSWVPLLPPWSEYTGGISFFADGGNWYSHGAFASRSSMTGPLWLIISEVLDPKENASDFMLKSNQYPVTRENAGLSQPYYCRHDFAHIKRGEVKAFLKTYYNQFTALQDRETYTFWEHYYGASQHKTHEEGWFLMQSRWMLYLEEGDTLSMLKAIPRKWLKDGKEIVLEGVKSYFGAIDFKAEADLKNGIIKAEIKLHDTELKPGKIAIRLPHPEYLKAKSCTNGCYDSGTETVIIENVGNVNSITLKF